MTDASDVLAMLRRHYLPEGRPAGGILAQEIQAPDSARRADAVWAPLVRSAGPGLVGHEIKVSRSDVLAELADPTKCEPWAQHCVHWWLTVSDPALVDGLDIPESWGIMAPPSGRRTRSMTIVRPAPRRKVEATGPAWRRILSWYHYRQVDAIPHLQRQVKWAEDARDRALKEVSTLRAAGARHPADVRDAFTEAAVQAVRTGSHDGDVWVSEHRGDYTAEDVAAAVLDLARARRAQADAARVADRAAAAMEAVFTEALSIRRRLAALAEGAAS